MTIRSNTYIYVIAAILLISLVLAPTAAFAQGVANPAQPTPNTGSVLQGVTSGVWNCVTSPINCTVSIVVTVLGTLLVSLTTVLMAISASIFELLLQFTVVDLAGTLQSTGVAQGINHVWTAFRDIANILIIGMFVFIAISIILGITRYGDKTMIARVLIIAVLINFSLLFTRIIIESSNLVTGIFYKEAVASFVPASSGTTQTNQNSGGIAGAFLGKMGVAGVFETGGTLLSAGVNKGFYVAVAFALAASSLLLIVSVLFLYGGFLMLSRAILLVFITITSSLAFASYLIPKFSESEYGWVKWWDTLIKTALFGPLLMIFLWASLVLLRAPSGQSSVAAFLLNPADSSHWTAIIILLFTAGFLYISIYLATMFAQNIGHFSLAALAPAFALGLGGRMLAPLGRKVLGGTAGLAAGAMRGRLQTQAERVHGMTDDQGRRRAGVTRTALWRAKLGATMYGAMEKPLRDATKRDFNLANAPILGAEIKKVAGLTGKQEKMFTGPQVGGIAGAEKQTKESFAREGERLAYTKEEWQEVRKAAHDAILNAPATPEQRQLAEQKRQLDDRLIKSQDALGRAVTASIEHTNKEAESSKTLREAEHRYTELVRSGAPKADIRDAGADKYEQRRIHTIHKTDMEAEKSRIAQAQKEISRDKKLNELVLQKLDAIAREQGKLPEAFKDAQSAAFSLARGRLTNVLRESAGIPIAEKDDKIAFGAAAQARENKQNKGFTRVADILRTRTAGPGSPPPPPGTPGGP